MLMNLVRRGLLAMLALAVLFGGFRLDAGSASAQAGCDFKLGFRTLRNLVGGSTVGICLENEHFNPANGNAEQRTTGGLLVWRKADNWTAFTNGSLTWLNGPQGLATRPNGGPLFAWEADAGAAQPVAATGSVAVPSDLATLTTSGWATVVEVTGPATLTVQNALGQRFGVWHIGIIGPTAGQGNWLRTATAEHARILPPGTRVWLQNQEGLANPAEGWALRHVLRDGDAGRPVGGELLRAGDVWVFPHTVHDYVSLYADRQAEAVLARSGAWAETQSSAIFRPHDVASGGFPISPRVQTAMAALDASEVGHALLTEVNQFPVEVGVSALPTGSAAFFQGRTYSVQLGEEIMSAEPGSVAAVLIHELTHARQMIDGRLDGHDIDCYAGEVEAFQASALYWSGLYGSDGKQRPTHWLDTELNATLRQYQSNQLEARVLRSYGHQCAA